MTDKLKAREILQNKWPVLLKNVIVKKHKEKLKKFSHLNETAEIWLLECIKYPGLNPGPRKKRAIKDILGEIDETWIGTMA